MACLSAGKLRLLFLFPAFAVFASCGIFARSDNLNTLTPQLLFGEAAVFLENTSSLAIKGRIEFMDGRTVTESGTFQLFLNGPDSASFLVEGPLGADAFKMVVLDDTAHIFSENGWISLDRSQRLEVAEYGIENISPFLLGPVIFPQYYPVEIVESEERGYTAVNIDGKYFSSRVTPAGEYFNLIDPETGLVAEYNNRENYETGYYPSHIEAFNPNSGDWRIVMKIARIRENPVIPPAVWQTF